MSRLDQPRPSKRLKHAHTATNGSELSNGIGALLDAKSGLGGGQKLKAKLSNDKVKNSRIAQLDESRTVVQANGDVEMQDQPANIIEISSDARSDSSDSSADEEEEGENAGKQNGVQDGKLNKDKKRKETDASSADQDGVFDQSQSLKSLKRDKRAREEDTINGGNEDSDNGRASSKTTLQNTIDSAKDNENKEASFEELLQAQAPAEPIDVTSAFASGDYNNHSLTNRKDHAATTTSSTRNTYSGPITANSLGTVLTQALRTNDNDLLESCLGLTDYAGVRATIERLPSHLATTLLLRLAERLHRRPGRAGNLMIWVQWSLVAHGGYLASQTEAVAKLSVLQRVVRERADGLQPLLRLKGKLDMLAAQLELRKKMKQKRPERGTGADDDDEDDGDDEGIIYVEGAEKDDDDDDENDIVVDDEDELLKSTSERKAKKRRNASFKTENRSNNIKSDSTTNMNTTTIRRPEDDRSSSEIDAMPTTTTTTTATSLANDIRRDNHVNDVGEGEEDDEEEDNSDKDLIDDEAEETDRDTGDDDDDDDDDLSDGSDLDGFIDDGEDLDEEEDVDEDE